MPRKRVVDACAKDFRKPVQAALLTRCQKRPLDEASRRAEIAPAATFLRHTHGSHLAMNGVPMGDIAAQLGPKRLAADTAYGTACVAGWSRDCSTYSSSRRKRAR
jgi:hypothetical protein